MTVTAAKPARTPGAHRAQEGEYLFQLRDVNHLMGGPEYSTANGSCVEGDRMIIALMTMPKGTGADAYPVAARGFVLTAGAGLNALRG